MNIIKKDIEAHSFKRVYLLCGSDIYLIHRCRDMIKKAVLGDIDADDSNMNFSYYDGNKGFDIKEMIENLNSFPFFSDHRLVIAEETGLFGASGAEFADMIEQIPDTTVLVIIDESPDKRTKLYKAIQKTGYVCEFTTPDAAEAAAIIGKHLSCLNKRISSSALAYFVDYVGGDLLNLVNEADKLADYTGTRDTITEADINAICTMQVERKIFEIVDNLIGHNKKAAMKIYFDLIALKESPLGILRFLMSQYNQLLQIRSGIDAGLPDARIASDCKLAPWLVKRSRSKLRNFTRRQILAALVQCVNTEESIKIGNIAESTGIEILLYGLADL
ncbi:MAG: DNA polymerase III subunit delta [Lachnospiraceae bacterium]|nr:DNA polymerase III subunit delta [Lachnospiraceae bacterium]